MPKQHVVRLAPAERRQLGSLIAAGSAPARTQTHARILLKADQGAAGPGWTDAAIAAALEVSPATIGRVRARAAREGVAAALRRRRPAGPAPRKLDGGQEAHLIALACSTPPAGHARWSLRLLADRFVELAAGAPVSHELVRRTLKKTI